jgi:hypothetical protein
MNDRIQMITTRNSDGSLTTSILNTRGIEIAKWENHHFAGEPLITLARQLRDEHPELFDETAILVDTAEESQKKNPKQYDGDGKLIAVPKV